MYCNRVFCDATFTSCNSEEMLMSVSRCCYMSLTVCCGSKYKYWWTFTSNKSINPNSNAYNNLEMLLHLKTKNNDSKILSNGAPDTIIYIYYYIFQSRKRLYNHKCLFVCLSAKTLNSLKSSSFIIHPSTFIILHSSFIILPSFRDF